MRPSNAKHAAARLAVLSRALCAGQGTKTNTLLDPYGLPSNKNNRPGT